MDRSRALVTKFIVTRFTLDVTGVAQRPGGARTVPRDSPLWGAPASCGCGRGRRTTAGVTAGLRADARISLSGLQLRSQTLGHLQPSRGPAVSTPMLVSPALAPALRPAQTPSFGPCTFSSVYKTFFVSSPFLAVPQTQFRRRRGGRYNLRKTRAVIFAGCRRK